VSATHNHGGPAVYTIGEVERDDRYARTMVERVVEMFAGAVARLRAAEAGFGRGVNFEVTHNRRIVMREGIVRTHGTFDDPQALCFEGPVDPELVVLAARDGDGK